MCKNSAEESRKLCFCYYTARGYPPETAARLAGYAEQECPVQAATLLLRGETRRKIQKLSEAMCWGSAQTLARAGLERIAFGGAQLVLPDGEALPGGLELFNVAELKHPKGGGWELKFFDRIKALALLAGMEEPAAGAKELLEALAGSAASNRGREADDAAV